MAQMPPEIPIVVTQDHHHHNHHHDEIHNLHQWLEFNDVNINDVNINDHDHDSHQKKSWVDEFMEFSAAKRGTHRRAVSTNELELSPNPSSTSDHNSTNEGQKGTTTTTTTMRVEDKEEKERVMKQWDEKDKVDEVNSTCMSNDGNEPQERMSGRVEVVGVGMRDVNASCGNQQSIVDSKRIKRILANRQSAQRSRIRKLQYISELERSVTSLQNEVWALSPRVAFLDHQRVILNIDNSAIKTKIVALAQDKIFKDVQQEELKREIERLRQIFYQQNVKKTEETITPPPSSSLLSSPSFQPPPYDKLKDIENEQLIN